MSIKDALNELREEFPACYLLAYTDVSTQLVLATSAQEQLPQERWDSLCAAASDLLGGDVDPIIASLLTANPHDTIAQAIIVDPSEYDIFLKSEDYALCCVCDPDVDLAAFVGRAQITVENLAADG